MQKLPHGITNPDAIQRRQEALDRIHSLQARASGGIWLVALFLVVSILASRGFDLFPDLSLEIRRWLGTAPPVRLIQLALVVYAFSAAVLILARMAKGAPPGRNFTHILYLTAFFGFFHFAKSLQDNFWAVLVAGLMITGLSAYQGWAYCSEQVRQEEELLAELERRNSGDGWP